MFAQFFSSLLKSYCDLRPSYPEDGSAKVFLEDEPSYDFIVIGAGSAGSVIANRLSEINSWRILLIEAGPDPPLESNIPQLWPTLMDTEYDWRYKVEPSTKSCRSMVDARCVWHKGKMLGGTSSLNAMYYVRGNPADYDHWEKLGNPGWDYDSVLKYFKKLEKVEQSDYIGDEHGLEGPLEVEVDPGNHLFNASNVQEMIKNAALELGYKYVKDLTTNVRTGITNSMATLRRGVRSSTATAYLVPLKTRQNLAILKETFVTRLLIEGETVVGVEVYKNGDYKNIFCRKEVVLSAGTIASAQLLMLSGIGPKEHLQNLGINVIKELKVGYNLQDHFFNFATYFKLNGISLHKETELEVIYKYLTKRVGLGSIASNLVLFVDTTLKNEMFPDVQFIFAPWHPNSSSPGMFLGAQNVEFDVKNEIVEANRETYLLVPLPQLLRPKSRGRIWLSSANPFDDPKIESGYLSHDDDLNTMIRAQKFLNTLKKAKSFQNCTLWRPKVQECSHFELDTDEYYECYIRNLGSTMNHILGTCKMGPASDPEAVVNPRLKVHGVDGLRVADASIMPHIISGNINIPVIMIGEKAADLIKEDWVKKNNIPSEL